jgi:hypothetical protein
MKTRRRQGATLGLVAVCVLVIIVVGIGCFLLAKMFGGGREVANATDAGALNIAKNAMKKNDALVSIPVPGTQYGDFVDCADPPGSINLLTYNRCVAQTLLVALNAQAEDTPPGTAPGAVAHAAQVVAALNQMGTDLKAKLMNSSVTGYFGQVTGNNNRMWGNTGTNVNSASYTTAFMKKSESTNVYFTGPELPITPPSNWSSVGTTKLPPGNSTGSYIRGYENITIPRVGSIMGVPVFPQQNPHLVALADFKQGATPPSATVPPNAFSVAASSVESRTGALGGAVAAAIIGASGTPGIAPTYDYAASVPGGYIQIVNLPSANMPAGGIAVDNQDNIFNNELYLGPGIDIAGTSSGAAFSNTDMTATGAWAAYNTSSTSNPNGTTGGQTAGTFTADSRGKNGLLYPPTSTLNGGPHPLSVMYTSSNPTTAAANPPALSDLLTITGQGTNCLNQMNTGPNYWLNGKCLTYLPSFEATFGHGSPSPSGGANNSSSFTNVDLAKGQVIAAFQSGQKNVSVSGDQTPSGMGVFANGVNSPYPQPHYNPGGSIQTTGTIDQLLTQVTQSTNGVSQLMPSCTKQKIMAALTQRCFEIKPTASGPEIQALWNTPLPIGQTAYIYLDTSSNTLKAFGQANAPSTLIANSAPDGAALDQNIACESNYSLDNNMIDVPKANGGIADNNLHDRPYTVPSGSMFGQDHATLVLSSGYNNLLGQLSFSNTTSGVENFSRPN